jgi:hypothetical protein
MHSKFAQFQKKCIFVYFPPIDFPFPLHTYFFSYRPTFLLPNLLAKWNGHKVPILPKFLLSTSFLVLYFQKVYGANLFNFLFVAFHNEIS